MKIRYEVGIGIILLGVSFWVNSAFPRPSLETLTKGRSAGFQGRDIADPLTPPYPQEIVVFDSLDSTFDAKVDPSTREISMQFLYQAPIDAVIYLSILNKKQEWVPFLVDHPLLHNLKWFYILDEPYVVYQRNFSFPSLKLLLQNIPSKEILTDDALATTSSLDHYNYLVTKRIPQGAFGEWWWFRKNIYLTEAFREVDGTIYMKLSTTALPFRMARQVITMK